jgi:hypothetical protein
MRCLACGGPFEYAGANKEHARCTHCLALYSVQRGQVTPIEVRAPDGTINPGFTATFAQNLGFAPRQASHHVMGVGGVNVKINTARMERDLKNKVSGIIWGWIIGAIIIFLLIGVFAGVGIYVYFQAKSSAADMASGAEAKPGAQRTVSWDGKTPYACGGNENVKIESVTANISSGSAITAGGNCQLLLVNCNITAPTGISALGNAKVTVKGGSIKASDEAINALGNVEVNVDGAKVTGKTSSLGNAKITGVK